MGPAKDILEVQNAIAIYQDLGRFNPYLETSYLEAHQSLVKGLVAHPGRYRTGNVGIFNRDQVGHMAPPAWKVPNLMSNLFRYLETHEDHLVIGKQPSPEKTI